MAKGKGKASELQPQLVDHVQDSSDEEIDEDVAFNSDDERKYGALFNSRKDDSSDDDDDDDDVKKNKSDDDSSEQSYDEDSDGIASDDEAEGGDAGQYMLDLLNNLDNKEDDTKQAKKDARKSLAHSKLIQESEFSTVVKGSDLTMDQLMGGIVDTKGFGNVQKAMKDMTPNLYDDDKRISTTRTPVAKVVSDRAQRKVAYAENVEEVGQWTTVTKRNREAETLDFRPKDRVKISKDELVGKFEATTDFEKEMAAALEEAGAADEKDMVNQEDDFFGDEDDDDLGRSNLSIEEYRKRRGELAKMRALMFYEEQKRHHMSKIKSKKYRKIRKKQRTRLQDSEDAEAAEQDEDYARELEEKAEMERMKERMSLKHRNTSKWAKRVLRRGANVDKDTRKALSEQVRIGDELKKKMQGQFSDSEDEDADGNLLEQARTLLTETEQNGNDDKKKGLFELAFMKKGLEAQRERAKQEARELLKELEANADSGSDADQGTLEMEEEEEYKRQKKRKKTASSSEMEKVMPKGKLIAKSLEFGNSNAVSVTGAIDLDMEEHPVKSKMSTPDNATDVELTSINVESMKDVENGRKHREDVVACEDSQKPVTVEEESNPWMKSSQEGSAPLSKKRKQNLPSISKQGVINVADVTNVLSGGVELEVEGRETSDSLAKTKMDDKVQSKQKIASLSQDELVRQAFATVSDKDIEDEFENEKDAMRGRDDHSKKKKEEDKKLSGWGSWAGEGAPAPKPPKKLPKRLQAPEKKVLKRRRKDDGKKNVIINAKRMKKTAKFQIENIPHPYSSRVQYERAMAGAMGSEWNVSGATKTMTRPDILTRAGKIIRPISKKSKVKRAPAKFN